MSTNLALTDLTLSADGDRGTLQREGDVGFWLYAKTGTDVHGHDKFRRVSAVAVSAERADAWRQG